MRQYFLDMMRMGCSFTQARALTERDFCKKISDDLATKFEDEWLAQDLEHNGLGVKHEYYS